MKNIFQDLKRKDHKRYLGGLDVFLVVSIISFFVKKLILVI